MNKFKLFLLIFVLPSILLSQEIKPTFGIKFSGFVKSDFFYDSRQTVNLREGHFLLYPTGKLPDANGADINAEPTMNFLSIQTRITGNITAPDALGAKITGVIEADFFGNENANFVDANGFRLRHAYAKMTWESTELLFGQFWHPLFIPSSFSEVISFNTGAPFQPFSRNPQIKITQKIGDFSLFAALCEQRDFVSPDGSSVLRNAVLPEVQGQVQYENKSEDGGRSLIVGLGGGFKSIRPLQYTETKTQRFLTNEKVDGFSSTLFLKYQDKNFTYKIQGIYGQNLFDLTMLGGYGIHEILDTTKNLVDYAPINTLSLWSELITKVGNFQLALWGGYTQNLGADESILFYTNKVNGTVSTMRGTVADGTSAIKSIFRISPRVVYIADKLSLAFELEYTSAAYAKKDLRGKIISDENGNITETESYVNIRPLFAVYLKF